MADKQFGVKQLDILGIGTPTIQSPNNLNLNANTVAISTNITVGGTSTFEGIINANADVVIGSGLTVGNEFIVAGISTFTGITTSTSTLFANQFIVAGVTTFAGSINANNGINLTDSDNKSILLGASDDMRIRHTGSHSEITDEGTGSLRLGGNSVVIGTATFGATMANFTQGGAAKLYYNNQQKLTTTSTGAEITGILTATEFIHAFGQGGTSNYGIEARSNSTQNSDTNKAIRVRNNSDADTFQVSYRGRVDAVSFHGDGSGLTNLTETTINSNADNRIITGSDSSNTLNAESNLTFNGSTLAVTGGGSFTGSVSIGGTLTYEDVTNVDSVGVITAREGIRIGAGKSIGSDGAAVVYYGDGSNLTDLQVGGASTIAFNNNVPIYFGDSNDYKIYFNNSKMSFEPTHSGTQQFEMVSNNQMYIHAKASGLFLRANNQEVLSIYGGSGGGIYFRHNGTQKLKLEGGNFTYENSATVTHASHVYIPDSIIHVGDTNTKIRFPEADTVTIETNGSERLRINNAGSWGIGSDFGTSGQVLKSGGSSAAPTWGAGGKLVNYAQTFKTDTFSQDVSANTDSNDVISISYAAASSSNKLLIMASLSCSSEEIGFIYSTLYIGGSVNTASIGDSSGSRSRVTMAGRNDDSGGVFTHTHNYLHSSPSTSSTTYSYRLSHGAPVAKFITLNQTYSGADNYRTGNPTSSITILEFEP